MAVLTVRLLGGCSLTHGEREVVLASARHQALLAHLVLHRDAPQPRQHLAFLLWPDSTESQARTNLRQALHHLRRALPDAELHLATEGPMLRWRADGPSRVDVVELEAALARAGAARELGDSLAEREALATVVERYGGDLLPASYDDWIVSERERLRDAFAAAAERLVEVLEEERRLKEAIQLAERLRRHDPLHEPTYRTLVRLHAANGDRAAALRTYHACVAELERSLGVEPDDETRLAYERLLRAPSAPVHPTAEPGARPAVVGRRAEWEELRRGWQAAVSGASRLVAVVGEAGIGKTRLAEELAAAVSRQGHLVARTRAHAAEGRLAYAPVASWLRSPDLQVLLARLDDVWLVELSRLLPELRAERPDLPAPGALTEDLQRTRLFEAMSRAVAEAGRPLLLVLDDVQWCDRETLEWLHYLMRREPEAGVLVVVTARSHDVDADHPFAELRRDLRALDRLAEIELAPLSSEETVQLARGVAGGAISGAIEASLYRHTGGIPLFVVETVRAGGPAAATGPDRSIRAGMPADTRTDSRTDSAADPRAARAREELPLTRGGLPPPRIRAVIESRLAALSPAAQELVQLAAVVGREVTLPVLAEASGVSDDQLVEVLDELWRHRILREHGGDAYDFAHDVLRDVVDAQVGPVLSRILHRRVAGALEAVHAADLDPVVGEVAAHHDLAGSAAEAIEAYLRAAEAARRVFAVSESERLVRRGLALLESLPETAGRDRQELELRTALSVCLVALHGYAAPEVRDELARATELSRGLGRPPGGPLLRGLAASWLAQGRPRRAVEVGRELLELAEAADDDVLRTEARYVLGVSRFWLGELASARAELEAAIAVYAPERHAEHVALFAQDPAVVCRSRLAYTLWFLGEPARARSEMEAALALGREFDHPFSLAYALNYAAWLVHDLDDHEGFRVVVAELAEVARSHPIGFFEHMLGVFAGRVRALDGDPSAGADAIEDGLVRYHATGQDLHRPYGLALLARTSLEAGDLERAGRAVAEALAIGERTGERFFEAELLRLDGEILSRAPARREGWEGWEEAESRFVAAVGVAREQGAVELERRVARSRRLLRGR